MRKSGDYIHERLWTGDGDAVEDESWVLAYADIHARVARLAGALRPADIGQGNAVVVVLPRSVGAVREWTDLAALNPVGTLQFHGRADSHLPTAISR
jgi:non-ribosomal peptide synthetase component E (peptide arylation enzyme)